jgi:hypothetical protein
VLGSVGLCWVRLDSVRLGSFRTDQVGLCKVKCLRTLKHPVSLSYNVDEGQTHNGTI